MPPPTYDQDGLRTIHNHDFMNDKRFRAAYARGMQAAGGVDYNWHWRVYIGLWAAKTAAQVPGDFVECGVNVGFLSSAIMFDLGWNDLDRTFFLLDTFAGMDEEYVSEAEVKEGILDKNRNLIESGFYVTAADKVRENFREFERTKIIEGPVPETLTEVTTDRIAYLHLDMNCAPPEVAALDQLWPRISPGGVVLMDDYAYRGYHQQKYGLDEIASKRGFHIAGLPTGQGTVIKGPEETGRKPAGFWQRLFGG
ncbi:class I SAM-dependent methyltransferase [Rhodobacteraceae bacterium NNCM2]|nr:class I SAM-dependent methyltransferase [Coraliihabitans acroporae]